MLLFDRPTVKKLIVEILQEHPEGMTSDELRKEVKARFLQQGGNWTDDLDCPAGGTYRWVNTVAFGLSELQQEGCFAPDLPRKFYRLHQDGTEGDVTHHAESQI